METKVSAVQFMLCVIGLVIGAVLYAQSAGAIELNLQNTAINSTSTIPYQGRLVDSTGNPLTDTVNMGFRLYATATGGEALWSEQWTGANSVQVSDGLFNVMLGNLIPIDQSVITTNSNLFLGVTIGTDDEMSPRVQLGSMPFTVQALTVPDGSITRDKLGSGALEHYAATTTQAFWDISSCHGTTEDDAAWVAIPGLSIDFALAEDKTIWVDFDGLGKNMGPNQAIHSNIFIDGTRTKLESGHADLSGCRNDALSNTGTPYCSLSNGVNMTLAPGNHSVEARVWCDGTDSNSAVYGGTLRVLILP
ncbi:MAG: hypothetical protein AAF639_16695 [Chloroflexota bacterium]